METQVKKWNLRMFNSSGDSKLKIDARLNLSFSLSFLSKILHRTVIKKSSPMF